MNDLKEVFAYLEQHKTALSLSQIALVKSFQKQYKKGHWLSDRQLNILNDFVKFLNIK